MKGPVIRLPSRRHGDRRVKKMSIIRTKKYQILEKFVVAPFRTVSFRAFDMFIKQCC